MELRRFDHICIGDTSVSKTVEEARESEIWLYDMVAATNSLGIYHCKRLPLLQNRGTLRTAIGFVGEYRFNMICMYMCVCGWSIVLPDGDGKSVLMWSPKYVHHLVRVQRLSLCKQLVAGSFTSSLAIDLQQHLEMREMPYLFCLVGCSHSWTRSTLPTSYTSRGRSVRTRSATTQPHSHRPQQTLGHQCQRTTTPSLPPLTRTQWKPHSCRPNFRQILPRKTITATPSTTSLSLQKSPANRTYKSQTK